MLHELEIKNGEVVGDFEVKTKNFRCPCCDSPIGNAVPVEEFIDLFERGWLRHAIITILANAKGRWVSPTQIVDLIHESHRWDTSDAADEKANVAVLIHKMRNGTSKESRLLGFCGWEVVSDYSKGGFGRGYKLTPIKN